MSQPLNKVSTEASERLLLRYQKKVVQLSHIAQPDNQRHHEALAEICFSIGAHLYHLKQSSDDINDYLNRSAISGTDAYLLMKNPKKNEHRSPWLFLQTLSIVVAFGNTSTREKISNIPSEIFCSPHTEDKKVVIDTALLICNHLNGVSSRESTNHPIGSLHSPETPKHARRTLEPLIDGLRAVREHDEDLLQSAMARVIDAHKVEALRGEYQKLPQGFMCLHGLMLETLGRERGLSSNVSSPYLPVHLLRNS